MNDALLISQQYENSTGKKALYDFYPGTSKPLETILFIHGYMGFKDWGCWNLVAEYFQKQGFAVAKGNLSHNGTSLSHPEEFVDLDSFATNSYSKELSDIQSLIETMVQKHGSQRIHLIGHSRAGGMVVLAGVHKAVKTISCWAPISSIAQRFPKGEELDKWRLEGVYYRLNSRTGQQMPHAYTQWTDFLEHRDMLDIETACRNLTKPICVIHGTEDSSVAISEGETVARWCGTDLIRIEGANHTFGAAHPWKKKSLPSHLLTVCDCTCTFINASIKE